MEIQRSIITLGIWTVSFLLTMLVLGTFGLRSFRETVLMSATAHGVWVWMSCEVLGAVGLLAPIGLMVSWMAWLLALAAIARSRRGYLRGSTRYWFSQLRGAFREWRLPTVLFPLSFSAAVVSILLVLALAAAPNNVDSMTYHLSRVMHWQQERSLDPYPTHILRQLWTGPWAELAVASLQVAVGNDRLANMPQWLAMLGSMIGVSRLASLLGASGRGQAFAVLVAVTIPMGIVQSTSTQNDYVVALWLVVFCVFFIGVAVGRRSQPPGRLSVLTCGAALGLAVLTKATAALFALPIAIWLGFSLLQHGRRAVWSGLTIFAIALGLNAPHFLRNVNIFGAAGGPSMAGYLNGAYGVPELVSNVVRNGTLHLATPFDAVNMGIEEATSRIHALFSIDVNDPRTTWPGTTFDVVFLRSEDYAGNPLHFILLGVTLGLLRRSRTRARISFACGLLGAAVLFAFMLRWQPWHSRLQLPLFVLGSALVGAVVGETRTGFVRFGAMGLLAIAAMPYVIANPTRPLLGGRSVLTVERTHQYFFNRPRLEHPYRVATDAIRALGCSRLGLITRENDWEYPLWVLTGASGGSLEIQHVAVENPSARSGRPFRPCAILLTHALDRPAILYQTTVFQAQVLSPPVGLYLPVPLGSP